MASSQEKWICAWEITTTGPIIRKPTADDTGFCSFWLISYLGLLLEPDFWCLRIALEGTDLQLLLWGQGKRESRIPLQAHQSWKVRSLQCLKSFWDDSNLWLQVKKTIRPNVCRQYMLRGHSTKVVFAPSTQQSRVWLLIRKANPQIFILREPILNLFDVSTQPNQNTI